MDFEAGKNAIRSIDWDDRFRGALAGMVVPEVHVSFNVGPAEWATREEGWGCLTSTVTSRILPAPYVPSVYIRPDARANGFEVAATCSCERDFCLHAWAMVHHTRETIGGGFSTDGFLKRIAALTSPVSATQARARYPGIRLVSFIAAVPAQGKGLASMRVRLVCEVPGQPPTYLEAAPATIAELDRPDRCDLAVLRSAPGDLRNGFRPDMPEHAQAFERLLSDSRVRLRNILGRPLALTPPYTPELGWHLDDDGTQRASFLRPNGSRVRAYQAGALWDVDEPAGTISRLLCDAAVAERLADMPALPPTHAKEAIRRWGTTNCGVLPQPANTQDIIVVTQIPTPILNLLGPVAADGSTTASKAGAELIYDYDGVLLSPEAFNGSEFVLKATPNGVKRIYRERATEFSAQTTLMQAGLSHSSPGDGGGPDFVLGNAPDDHAALLNLAETVSSSNFLVQGWDRFSVVEPASDIHSVAEFTEDAGNEWFTVGLGVDIGGARHSLVPLIVQALEKRQFTLRAPEGERANRKWTFRMDDGTLLRVPLTQIREWVAPLAEWLEAALAKGATGIRSQPVRLSRLQAATLAEELQHTRGHVLPELRAAIARLRAIANEPLPDAPPTFCGQLRPYQREGLRWLNALAAAGLGGILADDMGLGKTVQVLAHILHLKHLGQLTAPVLIILPTSLLFNWTDEARRFTPSLRVLSLRGPARAQLFELISDYDLVLTTYPLLTRDRDRLAQHRFPLAILDEAGNVKNDKSHGANVVRQLQVDRFVLLSGTPVENHLGELRALTDIALPTLLGDHKHFVRAFRTPIEKHGDSERMGRLQSRIRPFMLRRTKDEVAADLPPKTETTVSVELTGAQLSLYETLRVAQHERVRAAMQNKGLAKSGIVVIDALLKLRQVCCDPRLVKLATAKKVKGSAKLEGLLDLVQGVINEGRRALIFSQFTEMLALIGEALDARQMSWQTLTGKTPATERQVLVKRFQAGKVPLFLISLKAGGVGLNLTAADTVIHYDPWWNPAVENQATDRAHRIGQDKSVFVYKLLCVGTVEEKIQAMQKKKGELAKAILAGGSTTSLRFTEEDVEGLFGTSARQA